MGFDHASSQPVACILAFFVTFFITPLIKSRAVKIHRKEEGRNCPNTPRLGGMAILISIIITVIFYLTIFGRFTPVGVPHWSLEAIAVGGLIIFFLGLLDDLKPLPALTKLLGQVMAAAIVWLMGIKVEFLANPIHYFDHARTSAFSLNEISSLLITILFIVAITNAINLVDGIDGLAVGVCMIAAIAIWAINLSPLLNQPAGAIFSATMVGSCFAFLRYNFNPAKIFLGDNGSYLLGFTLACIACIGLTKKIVVVILSPIFLLIFFVPLIDMIYVIAWRVTHRKPIFKADLEHLHHQLLKQGLKPKQISYLLYSITFLGGLISTFILDQQIGITYLIISAATLSVWIIFSTIKFLYSKPLN